MEINTLESLPNEVLLIVFGYLSSFDLCRAFLEVQNARIEHLVTSIRHSLDVSSMHYNELCRFLSSSEDAMTKRFTALIDTLVLSTTRACWMLVEHWNKILNEKGSLNVCLPSIKKLIITYPSNQHYLFVTSLLKRPILSNNILQRLHLICDRPTTMYSEALSELISRRISIHTMVLEVEQGHKFHPNHSLEELYQKMQSLHWPNTVRLTLSVQRSRDIVLLLRRDALPAIEHLNITNEEIRAVSSLDHDQFLSNSQLSAKDLHLMSDSCQLRSLLIRCISLSDLVLLIGSLKMPLLEKLTLIDLYDNTLDHVGKFQELCCSTHLPALKCLHFSLCFPQELEHKWRISSFGCNGQWPFDDIGCYIDERRISIDRYFYCITKTFFIVYKRPISMLLQHTRTVHNHCFALHASVPIKTIRRQSLEWTCDPVDKPDQLINSLRIIASGHVDKLTLTYPIEQTRVSMISTHLSNHGLLLNYLRSMIFNFESKAIGSSQRAFIVQQILDASPNLSHLVIAWKDFLHCSQTYSHLQHVHLVLDRVYPEPSEHLDIHRLVQLVPNLRRLETSRANITFNENLIEFILKIIRRLNQLVILTLNKHRPSRCKREQKMMFQKSLIEAINTHLFHCNNVQIQFSASDLLSIWL